MDEQELSRRLAEAAELGGEAAAQPGDLSVIERGAARTRARRTWFAGVAAAMLVAGAGGAGFGLGQAAGDGGSDSAASDGEPVAPPAAVTTVAGELVTTTTLTAPLPVPTSTVPPGVGGTVTETVAPAGDSTGYMPYPLQPLTLLGARQLADGTRVRVLLGEPWDTGEMSYPGGFEPASWCMADRELRVTVDGPDLVDVVGMSAYSDLGSAPVDLAAQRSELGRADGRPLRAVLVQSSTGATAVTVRWDDGATDTAEFVEGIAVLVVDGADAWERTYELDVTGPDGDRTVTGTEAENLYELPEWRAGCQAPPPSLPEAGEQPADPAAAEEALRAALDALWDREIPRDDKQHLLDDWTGVGEAIDAVDTGPYAEAAASAVRTIDELVFASPTEAWFLYSITTDITNFYDRYGRATLVDGSWQFPRALICQDVQLAGSTCQPPVAPIYPPSWFEINGSAWYGNCDAEGRCTECQVFADGSEECTESGAGESMEVPAAPIPAPMPAPTSTAVPVPATTTSTTTTSIVPVP